MENYEDDLEEQALVQESEGSRNPAQPATDSGDKAEEVVIPTTLSVNEEEEEGTSKIHPKTEQSNGDHLQKLRRGSRKYPTQAEEKNLLIAGRTKKLNQAKKFNAELHKQLQRFYTNDAVVQLENRLKEKQKRIDELVRENRTLKNSERLLLKEIEDIQNSKDNFPSKKHALQEELRVCKERIKQLREQYRAADEKGFKLHQQSFDLIVKNKGLSEKVRLLEGATAPTCVLSPVLSTVRVAEGHSIPGTSPEEVQAIIASQEEEITRLNHRVALMKKTHRTEQTKYERLLKASQDEIEQTRAEMEEFYQQLFAKERAARSQFLHMKKLKNALHELASTQQTNQRFQPFLANREMRIMNRSNGPRHPQVGSNSSHKGPTINAGRWITEALHHLGFVMPLSSQLDGSTKSLTENVPEEQVDIPENCIQGRLVPIPPLSINRVAPTSSTRLQFYNSGSTRSNGDFINEVNNETSEEEGNQ